MSTPLYMREMQFYGEIVDGDDGQVEVIAAVEEALLIEKVSVVSFEFATLAGRAILSLVPDGQPGIAVKILDIEALAADGAGVDFEVDIVVPVGFSLNMRHNVQLDPTGDSTLHFGFHGGILR